MIHWLRPWTRLTTKASCFRTRMRTALRGRRSRALLSFLPRSTWSNTREVFIWSMSFHRPKCYRAGVVRQPSHVRNRVREINIENDALSWAVWAEAYGIHPLIIAWAKQNPTVAFSNEVPATDRPFSTARSLARAAAFLQVDLEKNDDGKIITMELPSDALSMQAVMGDIGEGATADLFGYLKVHDQLPTLDEIMADPKAAKCPKDLSAGWASGQMCVHYAKGSNIDKLWQYTERLPKEVQVSMAKSLLERSGSALLNSPALIKWIHANKALINMSNG
jgi:hypothetical protein